MRVAVFGAGGQLGAAMVHGFRGHDVFGFDHAAVDITSPESVGAATDRVKPEVFINCAACNAVDRLQDEPIEGIRVNALAVRTLARAARVHHAVLVHYSSDFVFRGDAAGPYAEMDRPNPRSVYAATKLLGEWFAEDAPEAYVLRVESLFGRYADGPPDRGSAAAIINGLVGGTSPKAFVDRTVSPTYVIDAVRATRELVERKAPPGLYHCVNSGRCTWAEFAEEAARLLQVPPNFAPVRLADVRFRAPRPQYGALSNEKLKAAGIAMPTWQDALRRHIAALSSLETRS